MHYPPVFESMYNRTSQIDALFSLAFERGDSGGYLAFGGLPPIDFVQEFVTTKFVGIPTRNNLSEDFYYSIQPQGYVLNGETFNTSYVAIFDSGTYANRLPTAMADKINAVL